MDPRAHLCSAAAVAVVGEGGCYTDAKQVSKLVILGTHHSPQLVAESYQPAVFRAFFERIRPDAVCIEHPPEDFSRGDYRYGEYAYEKHHIALPWGRERGVPVYPVDWIPPSTDQLLIWGVPDIEDPGFVRTQGYVRSFLSFGEDRLNLDFFFAEREEFSHPVAEWYDQPRQQGERDSARRLGLYRTFLQAMRIKAVTRQHPGGTVLVVIGYFHKGDIEGVLGRAPGIEIAQPSTYGQPEPEEIEAHVRREDLLAVLSFNLLGVQSRDGAANWEWVRGALERVETQAETAETLLLRTRLEVLTSELAPKEAILRYERAQEMAAEGERFTFDGVQDRRRIDSYYDPFGNLTIRERTELEEARESHKLGQSEVAARVLRKLMGKARASELQRRQLEVYWEEFVLGMR